MTELMFGQCRCGGPLTTDHLQNHCPLQPRRELNEAAIEELCERIYLATHGRKFAFFRAECLKIDARFRDPAKWTLPHAAGAVTFYRERDPSLSGQRKEFAPLYEGDKLIGQMVVWRPRDAKDYLPFIERIHPDDEKRAAGMPLDAVDFSVRVQRFNLHKGRYVLEGTEPC